MIFIYTDVEAGGQIVATYHDGEVVEQHLSRLGSQYIENSGLIYTNTGHMDYYPLTITKLENGTFTEIFANTYVNDGTDKSELMKLMLRRDAFYNEKFPAISDSINYFKKTKGGFNKMYKAVEEYAQSVATEANKRAEEARRESEEAKKKVSDAIIKFLRAGKLSFEEIADVVSEPVDKIKAMADEMNGSKI